MFAYTVILLLLAVCMHRHMERKLWNLNHNNKDEEDGFGMLWVSKLCAIRHILRAIFGHLVCIQALNCYWSTSNLNFGLRSLSSLFIPCSIFGHPLFHWWVVGIPMFPQVECIIAERRRLQILWACNSLWLWQWPRNLVDGDMVDEDHLETPPQIRV